MSFSGICCLSRLLIKNKRKQKIGLILRTHQKAVNVEHEGVGGSYCSWSTWNGHKSPKKLRKLKIRGGIEIIALLKSSRILRRVL